MNIGGGKVRSERMLLAKVENGKNMMSADSVRFLVLHCSATRCNQDYSVEQLRRDHKARGFYDIGYHFYIRKDGTMTQHRKLLEVGAHARPYNRCSIGICYEAVSYTHLGGPKRSSPYCAGWDRLPIILLKVLGTTPILKQH